MGMPVLESVYRGRPKVLCDERGEWRSSIARDRVEGRIEVLSEGFAGDQVTQAYHGGPEAALCIHLADHYRFWAECYGVSLQHGGVGENLVLEGISEDGVLAGDVVRAGTALVQVSGPRVPCANQARHVGRADWVKLTIRENRTGFYVRVLEAGAMGAGDRWELVERPNAVGSIPAINRCLYLEFDADFAREALTLQGLGDWWKEQFRERLAGEPEHWTQSMRD